MHAVRSGVLGTHAPPATVVASLVRWFALWLEFSCGVSVHEPDR